MKPNIAIVGFSQSSRHLAPYDRDDFEIWGCNHVWKFVPRVDMLFELHTVNMLEARYKEHWPDYRAWMEKTKTPIYMREAYPEFPSSRPYPLAEMMMRFNYFEEAQHNGSRAAREKAVFKSTISYMMAMAITRDPKPKQINLYGIDMTDGTEWALQRPDLMRFIGHAREAGIGVSIPVECALLREGGFDLYAYEDVVFDRYKRVIREFEKRAAHYDRRMGALAGENDHAISMASTSSGAAQAIAAVLSQPEMPSREELEGVLKNYRLQNEEWEAKNKHLANEMGQTDGMLQECQDWLRQLTQGDRGWP